jgi:hypothetical protein
LIQFLFPRSLLDSAGCNGYWSMHISSLVLCSVNS